MREAEEGVIAALWRLTTTKRTGIKARQMRGAVRGSPVSQARKGIRWMHRRPEAKKDVASCEKPWGAAGRL